jgi:arylsulfatase A-like enzyme
LNRHLGGCIDFYYQTYGSIGLDWYKNEKLYPEEGYATDLITTHAINFINEQAKKDSPFFLYLPYNAPHYGKSDPENLPENTAVLHETEYKGYHLANTLQAPAEYVNKFSHVKDPYRKFYSAMVSNLDDNVGKVLKELEEKGLHENTMVWFISDNGGYSETHHAHASNGGLRGQKGSLWEGGIRVPAFVFWKNGIRSNQVINTPVVNVDIVPAIASIVGFKDALNSTIDGKDITPVLFNGEEIERDIYWKQGKQTAIRRGDWKLVNRTELYNLKNDRRERINLASEYPEKVSELQKSFIEIDLAIK